MVRREKKRIKKSFAQELFICKPILYICTFLQVLMWVFFGLKCRKLSPFYILKIFATTDVVALNIAKLII